MHAPTRTRGCTRPWVRFGEETMETRATAHPPTYSPHEEFAHVRLPTGTLRGRRAGGVHAFRGVPYAAPPFGPRRFRPPQPVEPWTGARDALDWGAEPPQPRGDAQIQALAPDPAVVGEGCRNLNEIGRAPGRDRVDKEGKNEMEGPRKKRDR
jgi:hypothetical protein